MLHKGRGNLAAQLSVLLSSKTVGRSENLGGQINFMYFEKASKSIRTSHFELEIGVGQYVGVNLLTASEN